MLRTPQNNEEEGMRAKKLVTRGTRDSCHSAEAKVCLSARKAPIALPLSQLELELIQTQMAQKPMLRAEVGMRVRCANKASAE